MVYHIQNKQETRNYWDILTFYDINAKSIKEKFLG